MSAGETLARWSAIARSSRGACYIMFGLVITAEAHVAFAGASHHTKKHLDRKHFFKDSKHATGVCLGTVQSQTNVCLGMTSQKLLLQVQLLTRITLRHIKSHGGNV